MSDEHINDDFTNDKKNQGSVNPTSENSNSGVYTDPFFTIDKHQGNLYKENSYTAMENDPQTNNKNKKCVYTDMTLTPNIQSTVNPLGIQKIQKLFSQSRATSRVVYIRIDNELFDFVAKKAKEAGLIPSAWIRCILIADYLAENFKGIDSNSTLDFSLIPKVIAPLNLSIVQNNVNVGRPVARRYERELEEPRLRERLRALAGEVLSGPPKKRRFNPKEFDYEEVDPTPEEVAEWLARKEAELTRLLRRVDKLKIALSEGEEAMLREVKEKFSSLGGGESP